MGTRCSQGDLVDVYKIFNKISNVDLESLLELSQTGLISNGQKIKKNGATLEEFQMSGMLAGSTQSYIVQGKIGQAPAQRFWTWYHLPKSPAVTIVQMDFSCVKTQILDIDLITFAYWQCCHI